MHPSVEHPRWSADPPIAINDSNWRQDAASANALQCAHQRGLLLGMSNLPDGEVTRSVRDPCAVQLVFVMHAFREIPGHDVHTGSAIRQRGHRRRQAGDADPQLDASGLAATNSSRMTRRSPDADDHHALSEGGAEGA
jgi:hypothetical protein